MNLIWYVLMQHNLLLQVLLPLFCYCQLDNFAWGTRGIDATETAGEGTKEIAEKKAYEVRLTFCQDCLLISAFALDCLCVQFIVCVLLCFAPLLVQCWLTPAQSIVAFIKAVYLHTSLAASNVRDPLCLTPSRSCCAGRLQAHEAPHQQAQRLCHQVHGACSLPHSQHGHWLLHCCHHNVVLVGVHDDGHLAVPTGRPYHHLWPVPRGFGPVLPSPSPSATRQGRQGCSGAEGCSSCKTSLRSRYAVGAAAAQHCSFCSKTGLDTAIDAERVEQLFSHAKGSFPKAAWA